MRNLLQNCLNAFFKDFFGGNKFDTIGIGIGHFLRAGTAHAAHPDLDYLVNPGHFRSPAHDAAIPVGNAVSFVTPVDMGIDLFDGEPVPIFKG